MARYSLRSSTLRQRGRNEMKNSSGEEKLQLRQSPRLKEEQRIAAMEKCNQAWLDRQAADYAAFKHAANEGDTVEMAKLWRQLHTTVRLHYVNYEVNNTWVESDQFKQMCALLRSAPTGTY